MRTIVRNSTDVKDEIDRLWAERALHVDMQRERYPAARVLAAVAAAHNLAVGDLRSRSRVPALSRARHHAVWELRRRRLDLGFQQIAAELNRTDHTTALNSWRVFCRLVAAGACAAERAAVAQALDGPA